MQKQSIDDLSVKWPSTIVSRTEVHLFSGGLLTGKYLANLDCRGLGPERIRVGRKIVYPVKSLVEWIKARAEDPKVSNKKFSAKKDTDILVF